MSTWRTQLSKLLPRPEVADHPWEDQASAEEGKIQVCTESLK